MIAYSRLRAGSLSEVHIPLDSQTKKSKAIAFISFTLPESAVAAYSALDGKIFQVSESARRLIIGMQAVEAGRTSLFISPMMNDGDLL